MEILNEENNTTFFGLNETRTSTPETSQRILDFGLLLYQYYTPLLFIFGVVGNSLSILVFLVDPKYRRKSSTYYLIALAISDTGFLTNLFAVWLGSLNNGVITSSFICPLVMYLGQVTCFVTVYLTVSFSIERYIAVYFPLRKLQLCSESKARKVIFGILALALVLFSYVWFIAEVVETQENGEPGYICAVPRRYHKISEKANYLDSIFTFIIPFFVITYFNVKIAIKFYQKGGQGSSINAIPIIFKSLIKLRDVRKISLPKIEHREYDENKHQHQYLNKHINRLRETRITKTLLLVSVMFLVLNVPLHIIRCAEFIQHGTRPNMDGIKLTLAFQPWAMMLFNTNFAINFLLYCMSGKGFRNSLRSILARFIYKIFCEKPVYL